jgi:hypothetical protein
VVFVLRPWGIVTPVQDLRGPSIYCRIYDESQCQRNNYIIGKVYFIQLYTVAYNRCVFYIKPEVRQYFISLVPSVQSPHVGYVQPNHKHNNEIETETTKLASD